MDKYRILVKGIVEYENKYLLVRKWYDDRVLEPYQWEFVDGVIDFGEAPDKAVLRIISEQTGLSATMDKILYTWTFMMGDVFNIGISYLCRVPFDEVVLSEELLESMWVGKDDLVNYLNSKIYHDVQRSEL